MAIRRRRLRIGAGVCDELHNGLRRSILHVLQRDHQQLLHEHVSVGGDDESGGGDERIGGPVDEPVATNHGSQQQPAVGGFLDHADDVVRLPVVGLLTNVVVSTNTTLAATNGGSIGQQYTVTTYSQYTNHTMAIRPGACESALAFATNYTTRHATKYTIRRSSTWSPTAIYTNTYQLVVTTNLEAVTNGLGGPVDEPGDDEHMGYNSLPSGDFWIMPTTWCGYQLVGLLTNVVASTNTTLTATNGGSIGQQYTVTTYSQYTNHTMAIRPGDVRVGAGVRDELHNEHPDAVSIHVLQYDHEQLSTPTRIRWW